VSRRSFAVVAERRIGRARRGFTLLEVMVAVAILGLGLTAIFAAQAGALAAVSNARNLSQATGLARCKMSEVEADMTKNGLAQDDLSETGPCCDATENPRFSCTWRVDRPVFPDAKFGDLQLDTKLDLGGAPGPAGAPGAGSPGAGSPGVGALNMLAQGEKGKVDLPQGGSPGDLAQNLAGQAGGIADGITQLVMSIVYPDLKTVFEQGTRKVTVTVTWTEGNRQRTLELYQWVTNAKAAGIVGALPDASGSAAAGAGNAPSTGAGSGNDFAPKGPRMGN
jgi:general secretion pathway protein I